MIKGHFTRITTDGRGKIKSGKIRPGTSYPMSLDYFNVSAFKELLATYGAEPDALVLFFPSNNIEDFFDDDYNHYAGGKDNPVKTRSCDSEKCIHRIAETCNGVKFVAGEESDCVCVDMADTVDDGRGGQKANPDRCKYVCYLKGWIGLPPTFKVDNPSCYLFETHSKNSGANIKSEIEKVLHLNMGNIAGIPFKISVKMVSGRDNAKEKFPIWNLQMMGLLSEVRADRRLSDGFESGALQLTAATDTGSDPPININVTDLLMELEEIKSAPTTEKLDNFMAKRKEDLKKVDRADQPKIRKLYNEINAIVTPPEPTVP